MEEVGAAKEPVARRVGKNQEGNWNGPILSQDMNLVRIISLIAALNKGI